MGVKAAREGLFDNATCVVTPTQFSPPDAVEHLREFWQALGSKVMIMTPDQHDELVGRSSHLVHLIAAALTKHILNPVHGPEQAALCANGFRDTTRIASGSPEMWRDIALANQTHLQSELKSHITQLEYLSRVLEEGNAGEVERFFEQAKSLRDQWCAGGTSASPE